MNQFRNQEDLSDSTMLPFNILMKGGDPFVYIFLEQLQSYKLSPLQYKKIICIWIELWRLVNNFKAL